MWSEGIFLRYNDSVRGNDRRKDLPARQKNKQTYAFNIPTHGFSSWHNIYNALIIVIKPSLETSISSNFFICTTIPYSEGKQSSKNYMFLYVTKDSVGKIVFFNHKMNNWDLLPPLANG